VKPADKGSATVILDKEVYIEEAYRQLSNPKHYRRLEEPIFPETADKINEILSKLEADKRITQDAYEYLAASKTARPRQFYLLPKVHKEPGKWTVPGKMPPGRPIVSDCSSESYGVAEYIDDYLAPLAKTHPSFLKDTQHFLDLLGEVQDIPEDALLVTIDVDSLYTNIDNTDGINAVRRAFLNHPDPFRPDKEVLQLLQLSLENNDFTFNDEWFLQVWGTAMGKKFAPNYANLFMAQWEREALAKTPNLPLLYKRFLDDIFMIWTHGRKAFEEFFQILNTHHPSITLKYEIHDKQIDFLDTTAFKGPRFAERGILDTKVYFKPTDSRKLLDKSSFHPRHTFRGLIKSQILRYSRICNNKDDLERACTGLFKALKSRNYTSRFLREIKTKTLHPKTVTKTKGSSNKCKGHRCQICPYVVDQTDEVRRYTPPGSGPNPPPIPLTTTQDCNSTNGVYMLFCTNCGKAYVGETGNSFRTRINQHLSDIRLGKSTPVGTHFGQNKTNCDIHDVSVFFLETVESSEKAYSSKCSRLDCERRWIMQMVTFKPHGLNTLNREGENPVLPLVIPFSETATEITKFARDIFEQIKAAYPRAFPHGYIPAYSRNKNVTDMLVSAKMSKPPPPTPTQEETETNPPPDIPSQRENPCEMVLSGGNRDQPANTPHKTNAIQLNTQQRARLLGPYPPQQGDIIIPLTPPQDPLHLPPITDEQLQRYNDLLGPDMPRMETLKTPPKTEQSAPPQTLRIAVPRNWKPTRQRRPPIRAAVIPPRRPPATWIVDLTDDIQTIDLTADSP